MSFNHLRNIINQLLHLFNSLSRVSKFHLKIFFLHQNFIENPFRNPPTERDATMILFWWITMRVSNNLREVKFILKTVLRVFKIKKINNKESHNLKLIKRRFLKKILKIKFKLKLGLTYKFWINFFPSQIFLKIFSHRTLIFIKLFNNFLKFGTQNHIF